ncbi:hypothetical protein F5Y17DRAFT_413966 [Xylariaceae sp. FL0594]|nr:hypothetical protein F5Y17DRAFT_413966 [Xylariaceae sp. FL0594]
MTSEEVSEKSDRRVSTSIFSLGHKRNPSSTTPGQQASAEGPTEKRKKFLASVASIAHSQPKAKPAPGSGPLTTFQDADQVSVQSHGDPVPVKKRLSELRTMIKGVGNAKEGAKDEQPVKADTGYEPRPSMQVARSNVQFAGSEPSRAQPGPFGFVAQQNSFASRPSMQGGPSQMKEQQQLGTNPPSFGGIPRADTGGPPSIQTQNPGKSEESGKRGMATGFLGGLFHKQGNKAKEAKSPSPQPTPQLNQRPVQPPPMPAGYIPFRPAQVHLPGQQLGPHPMLAGQPPASRPGQLQATPMEPGQTAPFLQTAQMVTIRRPSEITVSSQTSPQPNNHRMPSPKASQVSLRQLAGPSPLRQQPNQPGPQKGANMAPTQTSPLSDNQGERVAATTPSSISRVTPNRKPVGSANSRTDGPYMTSAVPSAGARPERLTSSPSPRPGEQQRAPSQLSQAQPSGETGSFEGERDIGPPSLLSLTPSPVPSTSSPRPPGDHAAGDSPGLRGPAQGLGVFQNGPNPAVGANSGGVPNGLRWGPSGFRPMAPPLIPPSADDRVNTTHAPSSPTTSIDQGKLSKFFGAYDGGKPAAQPQANKERSAASKFLGAFKRSSKNTEASQAQHRPQTSPQISQNPAGPGRQAASPGTGAEQMQAARRQLGQTAANGMPMQGQARAGPPIPVAAQGGRGQMPPYMQRPAPSVKMASEPQYDEVPIPRGYEAVRGYGTGTSLAPSPYDTGRPGLPQMQFAQHPVVMQPGYRPQPIDPRALQVSQAGVPAGVRPNPRTMPQGWPSNTMVQQDRQPYPQAATQSAPPHMQSLGPPPPQNQFASQQFVQRQPGLDPAATTPGPQPQQFSQPQHDANWQGTDSIRRISSSIPTSHAPPISSPARQFSAQGVPVSHSSTSSGTATPQSHPAPVAVQPQTTSNPNTSPAAAQVPAPAPAPHSAIVPPVTSTAQFPESARSMPPTTAAASSPGGLLRSSDATRLTSRMSVSRQPGKNASARTASSSLSPPKFSDRAENVSSEPPGALRENGHVNASGNVPVHQVSDQDLSINVDRANNHIRKPSEDIYDATPRLPNATFQGPNQGETQGQENINHAGADTSRPGANTDGVSITAGAAVGAAAGVAAVTAGDSTSFLEGPDDSETDGGKTPGLEEGTEATEMNMDTAISPPQRSATITLPMEPEEKILVDQPVELAAVNDDDDDGIPMMTATSYPGQEWNPYGAGEFGDWE